MNKTKIAITLNQKSIKELDFLVKEHVFSNRSLAIQEAINDKLKRIKKLRLIRECAKLDPSIEKTISEENIIEDLNKWPEY